MLAVQTGIKEISEFCFSRLTDCHDDYAGHPVPVQVSHQDQAQRGREVSDGEAQPGKKQFNFFSKAFSFCYLGENSPSDVDDPYSSHRDHLVRQEGGKLCAEEAAKVRRGTQKADLKT